MTKAECLQNVDEICKESFDVANKLIKNGKILWKQTEKLKTTDPSVRQQMFNQNDPFTYNGKYLMEQNTGNSAHIFILNLKKKT